MEDNTKDSFIKRLLSDKLLTKEPAKETYILALIAVFALALTTSYSVFNLNPDTWYSVLITNVLGGPLGIPIYLMIIGIAYASYDMTPKQTLRYARTLLVIAFLSNVLTKVIPDVLAYAGVGKYTANYIGATGTDVYIYDLFYSDVIILAALSMFILAIYNMTKLEDYYLIFAAMIMNILGSVFEGMGTGNSFLDILGSWFWPSGIKNAFPLITWFIYPAFGVFLGNLLRKIKDKKLFYLIVSPIALAVGLGYSAWVGFKGEIFFEGEANFSSMTIVLVTSYLLIVLGVLGICYLISQFVPNKVMNFLELLTMKINNAFIFILISSCVLYYILAFTLKDLAFNNWYGHLLFSIIVFASSLYLVWLRAKLKRQRLRREALKLSGKGAK